MVPTSPRRGGRCCPTPATRLRPRILQRAHDVQTVPALVAAGIGAALVSARAGAIAPGLRPVPVDRPAARRRTGLARARREPSPTPAVFIESARDVTRNPRPRP
ncbi:LysR substrate-binding domain-containing protein [Embleya sp. NPDC008237]|uniref:LysR substrate-binding domain-containing protein n=1 Tax=Embleya sp. NPDC008237 TaxID=3363978 RepID=UPI0036EF9532